jgi:pyruvate kinase
MIEHTIEAIQRFGLEQGDEIVITAGAPFGHSGRTNLIQVHEVERKL